MNDGIIKGDGTSRLIRSVSDFKSRYPTYDDFVAALVAGTLPLDILFNAEGWSQQPDFLNKNSLLKDGTAALYKGLPDNPVPDDVLSILSKAIMSDGEGGFINPGGETVSQVRMEFGYYIGTGKSGSNNPNVLVFDFPVDFLIMLSDFNTSASNDSKFTNFDARVLNVASLPADIFSNVMFCSGRGEYWGSSPDSDVAEAYRSSDSKTINWRIRHIDGATHVEEQGDYSMYQYNKLGVKYWYAAFAVIK